MSDHKLGRVLNDTLMATWPFWVWLWNPGNFLIFVSILLALAQLAYTLLKLWREWKRKGAA